MMLTDDLIKAQSCVQELSSHLIAAYNADEFLQVIIEHVVRHPEDAYCDYPINSSDFPPLTKERIERLIDLGFTVDINLTNHGSARIYWVLSD